MSDDPIFIDTYKSILTLSRVPAALKSNRVFLIVLSGTAPYMAYCRNGYASRYTTLAPAINNPTFYMTIVKIISSSFKFGGGVHIP